MALKKQTIKKHALYTKTDTFLRLKFDSCVICHHLITEFTVKGLSNQHHTRPNQKTIIMMITNNIKDQGIKKIWMCPKIFSWLFTCMIPTQPKLSPQTSVLLFRVEKQDTPAPYWPQIYIHTNSELSGLSKELFQLWTRTSKAFSSRNIYDLSFLSLFCVSGSCCGYSVLCIFYLLDL